jgi:hypothetical protein
MAHSAPKHLIMEALASWTRLAAKGPMRIFQVGRFLLAPLGNNLALLALDRRRPMLSSRRLESLSLMLLVAAGSFAPSTLAPPRAAAAQHSCIAGEIVSLRTRDSSTYRNADCSYRAVH